MRFSRISLLVGRAALAMSLTFALALAACSPGGNASADSTPDTRLKILADSDLAALTGLLPNIEKGSGVSFRLVYVPNQEASAQIAQNNTGEADMAWLASSHSLSFLRPPGSRIFSQEPIMQSPLAVGLRPSKATALGWKAGAQITWAQLADRSAAGELHYALGSPTSSHTALEALISAATLFADEGGALQLGDLTYPSTHLRDWINGQTYTYRSLSELTEKFNAPDSSVDAVIDSEATLMQLNTSLRAENRLVLFYPVDGTLTANYPLILMNEGKRAEYTRLVGYLRSAEFQKILMDQAYFRPINPQVKLDAAFPRGLVELAYPARKEVLDGLLQLYDRQHHFSAYTIYVVNVSAGMQDKGNLDAVKAAFVQLAKDAPQGNARRSLTLLPFNHNVLPAQTAVQEETNPQAFAQINDAVQGLTAGGRVDVYSALEAAYALAQADLQRDPNALVNIVLLSGDVDKTNWDGTHAKTPANTWYSGLLKQRPEIARAHLLAIQLTANDTLETQLQALVTATSGQYQQVGAVSLVDLLRAAGK